MPAVAAEVGPRIVRVLCDEHRVRSRIDRGGADRARQLGRDVDLPVAARHVRDVETPAVEVERREEPPLDDGLRAPEHPLTEPVGPVVELREGAHAGPSLVAVGQSLVEPEEAAFGRVRVAQGAREPAVVVADVVDREVADDPDPPRVRSAYE